MESSLEQLVAMGFERGAASRALGMCDDQLDAAVVLLTEGATDLAPSTAPASRASPTTAPAVAPAPQPALKPTVAPTTPRLSRAERLEVDMAAMSKLVADPSSDYHQLLSPVWSWVPPQLTLCTAKGEKCTVTFDSEEYPQGADWTDHPDFTGSFPPYRASIASTSTRVRQLVDLIIQEAPAADQSDGRTNSGSDDSNLGSDVSADCIDSDDELFDLSGDNSEVSEDSEDDAYARAFDSVAPSSRSGSASRIHADLRRDVELVKRIFGPDAASLSDAGFEEKVVVELTLDFGSGVLGRDTMKAWKLKPEHPFITIRMQLDRHLYTETRSVPEEGHPDNPYFHVYSQDRMEGVPMFDKDRKLSYALGKTGIPVCIQLCHAVLGPQSGFVKRWWEAWNASRNDRAGTQGSVDPVTGWPILQTARHYLSGRAFCTDGEAGTMRTVFGAATDEEAGSLERAMSASLADQQGVTAPWVDPSWVEPDEAQVASLATVVGVDTASDQYFAVSGALALCANDPDAALNKYFDNPDACVSAGQVMADRQQWLAEEQSEPEPEIAGESLDRQGSTGSSTGSAGRRLIRQSSSNRSADDAETLHESDIPEGCFLLDLLCYLRLRLPTLNRYCVVSDKPHVFEPMLIPTVSSRPDAMFTFDNFDGWWNLAAKDVASQAEVVDLLVHMAYAIFHSSRWDTLLGIIDGPNHEHQEALFPTLTDPRDGKQVVSPKLGSACIKRIRAVLAEICRIGVDEVSTERGKAELEHHDEIGWKLFQWIIRSNRTYLVRLPPEKQIKSLTESGINCVHQFLMKAAAPEKEAKFQALKKKHSTVFAFHGSRMECWHAIVRAGLKNVSGTKMMTAGQAYGAGTYTSPDIGTSLGYSQMHGRAGGQGSKGGRSSKFLEPDVFCMAICEIIDTGSSIKRNGSVWVVPDNDHINTRFLLVWDAKNMPTGTSASTIHMDQELRRAAEQGVDIVDDD